MNGAGGFAAKVDYTTGANPNWVAIADVNGDGKCDLVTANAGGNSISVLLGNGSGGFGAKTDFAVGTQPLTLSIADLNGDANLDVAVANYGSNSVGVLLGNGAGGFGAMTSYAVPASPVTGYYGTTSRATTSPTSKCAATSSTRWRYSRTTARAARRVRRCRTRWGPRPTVSPPPTRPATATWGSRERELHDERRHGAVGPRHAAGRTVPAVRSRFTGRIALISSTRS